MVRIGPSNLLRGESGLLARENISEGTVVASFGAVRALRKGEVGTAPGWDIVSLSGKPGVER